jgi:hypothetical protein
MPCKSKNLGEYIDSWADKDGYTDRQQGDLISLLLFFQNQESRLKTKSLRVINKAFRHEKIWGSGDEVPPFLTSAPDGGEWSVSRPYCFTPYGNSLQCPLNRRLGGPHSRSGRCPCLDSRLVGFPVCSLVTIPTDLFYMYSTLFIEIAQSV